ncbi:hypothetical protein [Xanthomonas translucens]|uniref:hypothetical protein n=1 Tax=Xanthomonas campestris pv. translucens TaxID=343 RepID=UPI002711DD11|nr:hypothetical protein [Xanthomonas translucens]WLA05765.1 hypothetical protein MO329_05500 [Xanthomonas translucens]
MVHGARGFTPIQNGCPVSISTKETMMGNINRCFGSGGSSSARYQQDEHAQGSATPGAPHERDPYQPIVSNDQALAGLRPRVSNAPVHQRGQAINVAGLQGALRQAEELHSQIDEQVQQGEPGLQSTLESLETTIRKIRGKLAGSLGSRGPDDYLAEIEAVREKFNEFNRAAMEPGTNFGYSGSLHSGSFALR